MRAQKGSWRVALTRGIATLMAITVVFTLRPAHSSPGDIFTIPAPVIGSDPAKAADLRVGDASVSTQTGALQFSYPLGVPPGRNGMSPSLSLVYSSQGPIFGTVASGWSLPVPLISEDHSHGRLETRSPEVEAQQIVQSLDPKADDRFVSSLAGGRPLVVVIEPIPTAAGVYKTYRAANDSSWTRYERMGSMEPFRWRARTTDGIVMTFGDSDRTPGCLVSDQYAPLTGSVDGFGNAISYHYIMSEGECMLERIVYGQNGSLPSFAEIDIDFHPAPLCNGIPIGSQSDYRSGVKIVTGANKIFAINAYAIDPGTSAIVHTRQYTLTYDAATEACRGTQTHAPVRQLTSIQESAWGDDTPRVDLPAVRFDYNSPSTTLTTPQQLLGTPWGGASELQNLGWGYRRQDDRWPTVESMLQDVDGDGLQDLVINTSVVGGQITSCTAEWRRNLGPNTIHGHPQFSPTASGPPIVLPRLKWGGTTNPPPGVPAAERGFPQREGCALNGQATVFENSNQASFCHSGTTCASSADPQNQQTPYCYGGGTECPPGAGHGDPGVYRTYLAYRWLDTDSDGLVDLVAAVHGDIDRYDIEIGSRFQNQPGELPISGIPGVGQWPACPNATTDRCKDLSNCLEENRARTCTGSLCTVDWSVVNTCKSQSPTTGCANIIAKLGEPPEGAPPPQQALKRAPYMRCEGLYPWLIYKNTGNGHFATTATVKYSPIPLESASGDSSFAGPGVASESHAIMDFDGDGWLDSLARDAKLDGSGSIAWQVWLGDGTGGFGTKRYLFLTRPINCGTPGDPNDPCVGPGDNAISGTGGIWNVNGYIASNRGLLDFNGDGLPDHWRTLAAGNVDVAINLGTELELFPPAGVPFGAIITPATPTPLKLGNDAFITATDSNGVVINPFGQPILWGNTKGRNRVTDVDGDGRMDLVTWASVFSTPKIYFNVGGQLQASGPNYPGDSVGAQRETIAKNPGGLSEDQTWQLNADLVDLDGDGREESVYFGVNGFVRAKPLEPQPPRLLSAVHNGRGADTTISYGHMHEPGVVEQHPELTWADGRPKASPRAQWVVKSMTSSDDFPTTSDTTAYFYKNPRFSPDDHGHYAFRGFEEVTTTHPGPTGLADGTGKKTIHRYGYDVDWSGRLVATLVKPTTAEGANDVRTIDTTTWQTLSSFGGAIKTYHPSVTAHLTCANGQTDPALALPNPCLAATAPGFTQTTNSYVEYPLASGPKMLWAQSSSLLQSETVIADGDRETLTTYQLDADATRYFFHPLKTVSQHRVAGSMTLYAMSAQTWDPVYGTQLTAETWVDAVDANRSIARTVYDNTTGNVMEQWKPKQNAAGTTKTTFAYDARKLFAATVINEVGHQTDSTYEYGTGSTLMTEGPNERTCIVGQPLCLVDAMHPTKEQRKTKIDGLGRPIEQWQTVSDDGYAFTLYLVETNSYVDVVVGVTPTSLTNYMLVDELGTVWKQTKTEFDGHGRPLKTTLYAQGSAPADQVTSYAYRADGTLQSVSVPDPTVNNSTLVAYTYGFDSLGRPTSIRRPDSATPGNQSGVNIAYAGMTQTTSEWVGSAGGQLGVTVTINDEFGRLSQVQEKTGASTWATTTYGYGPDDLVTSIVDPQGQSTSIIHDFAGRRTQITRGSRVWKYTYDVNANMIAEQAPGSSGPLTDPDFTTTTTYDDLDRNTSKVIAKRTMSDSDRLLFNSGSELFTWDTRFKGQLSSWACYPPGADNQIGIQMYSDGQGRRTMTTQVFLAAGFPWLERGVINQFYWHGATKYSRYLDRVGGFNETIAKTHLDARALPSRIELLTPQAMNLAAQTRNVAGLVTKRHTDTIAPAFVESNWTYDKLGRVTDQTVLKSATPTTVVRQELTYFGNDDIQTLKHHLGTTNRLFTHAFDLRHQLTSVTTNTSSYFGATYQYGTAGRLTRTTHTRTINPTPAGTDLKPRNVNYVYGGTDPEQVTALTNVSGGATYASYTYDAAGNQLTRSYPPTNELWEYVYDGKDQLRRVTRKVSGAITGSEEYWYDESRNRTHVLKRNASGAKTELVWFIGDVEAHYDGAGTITKIYSNLSLGTPVARVERTGDTTTSLEFQFHGLANNTIAAVAQNGTINASFSYAPFGEVLEATNAGGLAQGTAVHKRRFNDKFEDEIGGLTYYGARFYDKTLIGWTQGDPLYRFAPDAAWTMPRRANLYSFSLQNAVRYIDPDGLKPLFQHIAENLIQAAPIITGPTIAQISQAGPPGRVAAGVLIGALVAGAIIEATTGEVLAPVPMPWKTSGTLKALPTVRETGGPKDPYVIPRPKPDEEPVPGPDGNPWHIPPSPPPPPLERTPPNQPRPTEKPQPGGPYRPHPVDVPKPEESSAKPKASPKSAEKPRARRPEVKPFGCGIECVRAF